MVTHQVHHCFMRPYENWHFQVNMPLRQVRHYKWVISSVIGGGNNTELLTHLLILVKIRYVLFDHRLSQSLSDMKSKKVTTSQKKKSNRSMTACKS